MIKPIGDEAAAAREQDVIAAERDAIGLHRSERLGDAAGAPWAGIGLSGGGIRSATFCLGVLQALAESGLLRRFDYISSVSGGGYIATSLQWWWGSRSEDADNQASLALGSRRRTFLTGLPGRTLVGPGRRHPSRILRNGISRSCVPTVHI